MTMYTYWQHTLSGIIQNNTCSRSDFQGFLFVFECIVVIEEIFHYGELYPGHIFTTGTKTNAQTGCHMWKSSPPVAN